MSIQAIDSLRYFAGKANELQALRDRVAELEELLGITGGDFNKLPIPPQQKSILNLLYRANGKLCSREHIYVAIFGMRPDCDQPHEKIIDTQLCRLRGYLRPHEIAISSVWGVGWFIDEDNRAKLRAWIESLG